MRMLRLALALLFALVLAACGSSTGGAGTPPAATNSATELPGAADGDSGGGDSAVDACSLVTDADMKRTTTFAVLSQQATTVGLSQTPGCTWSLDAGSGAAGAESVEIDVVSPGGRDRYDFQSGGVKPEAMLHGYGDAAFWSGGDLSGDIWAVKGDAMVHIAYSLPVDANRPQELIFPLLPLILSKV